MKADGFPEVYKEGDPLFGNDGKRQVKVTATTAWEVVIDPADGWLTAETPSLTEGLRTVTSCWRLKRIQPIWNVQQP